MNIRESIRKFISARNSLSATSVVQTRLDDGPGWSSLTARPHDADSAAVQESYADALNVWRRNPLAWRIIAITSDYVLGDGVRITSPLRPLRRFVNEFWNHPQNRMDNRLESMCDELSRSGDLFVLLFRNPQDGMSYIRFVTKDRIQRIETAPNDWENELAYYELQDAGEPLRWESPGAANAGSQAVMLHYTVNRPLGALLGESDLASMLPWLMRYARMLEDRLRLHWAVRSFLWMVTVPPNKILEKRQQYAQTPEAGSIVVKDESETWQAVSPDLHAADAEHDLKAVRGMIDAGSGYPPHWRGEAADANLATATAMQAPTERHLKRRQQYFLFVLQDILYHAYRRAVEAGAAPALRAGDYRTLFTIQSGDISRTDNESLARAARDLTQAYRALAEGMPATSPTLARLFTALTFQFAGAPLDEENLAQVMDEGYKQEGAQRRDEDGK